MSPQNYVHKPRHSAFGQVAFALILSCASWELHAQTIDPQFERLTIQDGLSNNRVNAILQDKKGFMWFGTEGGLNRFDGYTVTSYGHLPMYEGSVLFEDSRGLLWLTALGGRLFRFDKISERFVEYPSLGQGVHQVFEDNSGDLWTATWGAGVGRYVPTSDSFQVYTHWPGRPGTLPDNNVGAVCVDNEGQLLVGTGSGVSSFDKQRDEFHHLEGGPGNYVSSIVVDAHETVWAGTNHGLWEIDRSHSRSTIHLNKKREWNDILFLYEDSRSELWVASGGGISRFDRVTRKFKNFENYIPPETTLGITWPVKPIFEDRTGTLWSGVSSVLAVFDRVKQDFVLCSFEPRSPKYTEANVTSAMYQDRSGRMWFGTMSRGVEWTDRNRKPFIDIRLSGLSPSVISILTDQDGILWLGQPEGLCRLDPRSGVQILYQRNPSNSRSLSGNVIASIAEESPKTLWLGTYERGLNRFDKQTGLSTRFVHDERNPRSLRSNNIGSLLIDRTGVLWVGAEGLDKLTPGTNTFSHLNVDSAGNPYIMSLLEDQSGVLWIGTATGLASFDRKLAKFEHYRNDPTAGTSLSNNAVNALHEDRQGSLWIGTDNGLNKFEKSTSTFSHITEKDGLASDKIIGILEDDHGSLWMLTPKGISRYNPATGSIRNYDQRDGVRLDAAIYSPYFKDRNGEMFFGGFSGLIRFHPDSIKDNPTVPSVVITSFKKFEQPVRFDTSISEKRLIELSYKDNVFSFEFAALNLLSAEKNQYAYKLEGFDKDWIYSGTKRSATYTNLDGGTYVFRVKGSNNDGVWNEQGTSIAVVITPPPWKTTWAYLFYVSIAAMTLYGIRRYQLNKLNVRHQLELTALESKTLREVDEVKSRFFANISHEFRTPLSLILGPVEAMSLAARDEKVRENLAMILRNARRLLSLVNQLLDLSRIEGHKMKLRARETDLIDIVRGVAASFESLAVRKDIQLSVVWDAPVIGYFDDEVVVKIITNLLSNAFKFTGEGGRVSVEVRSGKVDSPGCVSIAVVDTGVGIPADQHEKIFDRFYQVDGAATREHEGTGIGLALTRELVQLHKGRIEVASEPGHGSSFTVTLPLGKAHLLEEEIVNDKSDIAREVTVSVDTLTDSDGGAPAGDAIGEGRDEPPSVLVVEDNADMRRYIRSRLEGTYAVLEAENGSAGMETAITSGPDLIVSDVMMPKMDGLELCKRLKQDLRTSHIPIILLTAKAGKGHRIEGLGIGADDYLVKPFDAEELAARIANLIEQRRMLRMRFQKEIVLKPNDIAVTPVDAQFLQRVMGLVEEHMADSEFGTEAMGKELYLSRMQLHRKLKALTGRSPHEFLRAMRLQRAAQLLRKGAGNVSEIAYEVGFNNLSHFAKSFREEFGQSPSEFVAALPHSDQ